MIYYKYTFQITSNNTSLEKENIFDILSSISATYGFDSFFNNENSLEAFISEKEATELDIKDLLNQFPIQGVSFSYSCEQEKDVNWNEEWEKNYFSPISFADGKCVVRAPFHDSNNNAEIEILISPKMAFGTGNHQTTSLIIDYLMSHDIHGLRVLDMGCGTGILGILSAKRGASHITAIDIDKWAYDNVQENAKLNNIHINEIILSDASCLKYKQPFDLILSNITRNILLQDMDKYVEVLSPEGTIILSGFYTEDVKMIKDKAEKLGLKMMSYSTKDNWALVEVKKIIDEKD